jgi:serine/threonine protein kinase
MSSDVAIGRFRPVEKLGEGAFGRVYKAVDPAINRLVALKLLRVVPSGTEEVDTRTWQQRSLRLLREAQAAAALSHHNIVRIYDVGEVDGWVYLVMEYLSGHDLSHRLRAGPALSLAGAISVGSQVADGLAHARPEASSIVTSSHRTSSCPMRARFASSTSAHRGSPPSSRGDPSERMTGSS